MIIFFIFVGVLTFIGAGTLGATAPSACDALALRARWRCQQRHGETHREERHVARDEMTCPG